MAEIVDELDEPTVVIQPNRPVEILVNGVKSKPQIAIFVPGPQGPPSTVPGPQGDQGEKGDRGDPGPPGPATGSYTHIQENGNLVWVIQHNLGYRPNVTVFDDNDNIIFGWKIEWQSDNILLLRFPVVQSGKSNLS